MINVPGHEIVFRDDGYRIAKFRQHFEAASCQFEFALDRLIAIGHATHGDDFRNPFRRTELTPQKNRRVLLHHDFGFEIQTGREAKVFVRGAGITIDTAVFAAAIRIDTGFETDIGTVVVGNDALGVVFEELRAERGLIFLARFRIGFEMNFLEPIRGILRRAAGWNR